MAILIDMNTYAEKKSENKSQVQTHKSFELLGLDDASFQYTDNRPETAAQLKLQEIANKSSQIKQHDSYHEMFNKGSYVKQRKSKEASQHDFGSQTINRKEISANESNLGMSGIIQKKENSTGLSDTLKSGIEHLSGYSMDDVKVHYNSSKPAQLNAHAYAQGSEIHLASGQEKHLPHEAWHVVQQKQGRVKPTMQLKGKVNINDDAGLEHEADVMGAKAMETGIQASPGRLEPANQIAQQKVIQNKSEVIQRSVGFEFETGYPLGINDKGSGNFIFYPYKNKSIIDGKGWHVECDSGALEFVTDPIAESSEGLQDLIRIMNEITHFALSVEQTLMQAESMDPSDAGYPDEASGLQGPDKVSGLDKFKLWNKLPHVTNTNIKGKKRIGLPIHRLLPDYLKYAEEIEVLIANRPGGMEASPQMTAGIKLDQISRLFQKISGSQPEDARKFEREEAIVGRADNNYLKLALEAANRATKARNFNPSGEFANFLNMLYLYIIYPDGLFTETHRPAPYPKDMPLLSRTDMGLFATGSIKNEEELAFLRDPESVMYYASVRHGNAGDPMFPGGYIHGDGVKMGPSRAEWLTGLSIGSDWFNKLANGSDNGGQKSMGNLGFGDSGHPDANLDRAIIELRRLETRIHARDWFRYAKLWYMLAVKNNTL